MLPQQKIKANSRKESKRAAARMSHRHTYKTRFQRVEEIIPWEIYSDWSRTSLRKAEWENGPVPAAFKGSLSKCTSLTSKNALEWHCRTQQEADAQVCFHYVKRVSENYFEWRVYFKNASKCFDCQQWNIVIRTYAGAKMYVIYCYVLVR